MSRFLHIGIRLEWQENFSAVSSETALVPVVKKEKKAMLKAEL